MYVMCWASAHGASQGVRPYPVASVCRCSGDALWALRCSLVLCCRAQLCCSSTVPRLDCGWCFQYLQAGGIAGKHLHHAVPRRGQLVRAGICDPLACRWLELMWHGSCVSMYVMCWASAHGASQGKSQRVRLCPVASVWRCSGDALRASLCLWVLRCRALLCCSSTVPRLGRGWWFMYLQEGSIVGRHVHHAVSKREQLVRACICDP